MREPPAQDRGTAIRSARPDTDEETVRYVQVARGLRWAGRTLTLVDLAPCTIYILGAGKFGRLSTSAFLDEWTQIQTHAGAGRVGAGTPAVVSLMDAAQLTGDAQVLLNTPVICADGLQYTADLLTGALPGVSGACVLFINAAAADVGHGPRPSLAGPVGCVGDGGRAHARSR